LRGAFEGLLGICFLSGVLEGVAEEIGEGRKGVGGIDEKTLVLFTSDKAHPVPSFPGQMKEAWTQPVWKSAATK
jgi:hypothetical protein